MTIGRGYVIPWLDSSRRRWRRHLPDDSSKYPEQSDRSDGARGCRHCQRDTPRLVKPPRTREAAKEVWKRETCGCEFGVSSARLLSWGEECPK
jgi:hypothetical protein